MTNNEDPTNIDNSGLEDNVSEDQPDTTPSGSDSEVTESDIDQDTVNYLSTDKQLSPEKLEIIEQKLQEFFQWEVALEVGGS